MGAKNTFEVMRSLGVSKICGSVIEVGNNEDILAKVKRNNDEALKLKEIYKDFYIPGFHIHPDFVDFSLKEMERMEKAGIKLIGELVPYIDGWKRDFASQEFSALLKEAGKRNMIVSFHSMNEDAMDEMVKNHKDVIFVAAHPGEYGAFMRHIERMKYSENYYLDISGYGIVLLHKCFFFLGKLLHKLWKFSVFKLCKLVKVVRTFSNFGNAAFVFIIIVVIVVATDVKATIAFQMDDLMYLKI